MRKRNKKSRIIILVAMLLAIIYGVGVLYFNGHFFPNTYVDNDKVDFMSISNVEDIVTKHANDYQLNLKTIDDRDQILEARDMDLSFEVGNIVLDMKKEQQVFLWPTSFFNKNKYHAKPKVNVNEEKLKENLYALPIFSKDANIKPKDAKISIKNNKFIVEEEVLGNIIKKKDVLKSVKEHIINNDETMDIDKDGCYKKPKIFKEDESIAEPMKILEKYNTSVINYEIEGADERVDPSVFSKWVDIDKKTYKVSLNYEKIAEYVKNLARKYDTWSLSREFKTTNGNTIKISGGVYGWLIERKAETDQLIKDIESGKSIKREPIYRYRAKSRVPNDIGGTYVEIDISKQTMWVYKDNQLKVTTHIVSGRPTISRHTPLGVYPISYKTKNATLRGPGYSSPVKLWIPFNNNIGIHDASWRSNFGGNIYITRGSHGCINTPYAAVKQIYDIVSKGDPVVIYASSAYNIRNEVAPKPKDKDENKEENKDKNKKDAPKSVEKPQIDDEDFEEDEE